MGLILDFIKDYKVAFSGFGGALILFILGLIINKSKTESTKVVAKKNSTAINSKGNVYYNQKEY